MLSVPFLCAAAAFAALTWRRRPRHHAKSLLVAAVALTVLTAVFDSAMIAAGFFTYGEQQLLGPRIALAPIEDFGYPAVALLVVASIWSLSGPARSEVRDED